MAKATHTKPANDKAMERQRAARLHALACKVWTAGLADMKGRVPQQRGVETFDPWAKMALAYALDRFTEAMQEDALQ